MIKVGSIVQIGTSSRQRDSSSNRWNPAMDKYIGMFMRIAEVRNNGTVQFFNAPEGMVANSHVNCDFYGWIWREEWNHFREVLPTTNAAIRYRDQIYYIDTIVELADGDYDITASTKSRHIIPSDDVHLSWLHDDFEYLGRKPLVGDRVVIKQSDINWGSTMNRFVGNNLLVKEIQDEWWYYFYDEPDGFQNYVWVYCDNHFFIHPLDEFKDAYHRTEDIARLNLVETTSGTFQIRTPKTINPVAEEQMKLKGKLRKKQPVKRQVIFSKSFTDFLREIENESKVAKLITSVKAIEEVHMGKLVDHILVGDEASYITYRQNGNISFLPKGKEPIVLDNGTWGKENRQEGKPAKVMRKIFTPTALKLLKDSDFEVFNNKFKAKFGLDAKNMKLFDNTKIADVYRMETETYNGERIGQIGSSCMRDGDREWFDIYVNNPNLQILTMFTNDDVLCGRALVWHNVKAIFSDGTRDTITFMDRIYTSKDILNEVFIDYAKEKGWWYKRRYNSREYPRDLINPSTGEGHIVTMRVDCDTDFEYFPYIDTFQWGGDGYLSNQESDGHYTYNSTSGDREDNDGTVYDDITGNNIDQDYAITITAGSRRYRNQITHIDNTAEVDGEYYYREDSDYVVYSGYHGEWMLTEDACYSNADGEWYKSEDCAYVESLDDYYLKGECKRVDGVIYHESQIEDLD